MERETFLWNGRKIPFHSQASVTFMEPLGEISITYSLRWYHQLASLSYITLIWPMSEKPVIEALWTGIVMHDFTLALAP